VKAKGKEKLARSAVGAGQRSYNTKRKVKKSLGSNIQQFDSFELQM